MGAPVVAHAVHHAAPVVHAAPAYHAAPVVHAAEVYPDEISPYTYNYAVADDYSKSNFNAGESNDGTGVVEGSYSVALPDGRCAARCLPRQRHRRLRRRGHLRGRGCLPRGRRCCPCLRRLRLVVLNRYIYLYISINDKIFK